jgi:hypothetical protein
MTWKISSFQIGCICKQDCLGSTPAQTRGFILLVFSAIESSKPFSIFQSYDARSIVFHRPSFDFFGPKQRATASKIAHRVFTSAKPIDDFAAVLFVSNETAFQFHHAECQP